MAIAYVLEALFSTTIRVAFASTNQIMPKTFIMTMDETTSPITLVRVRTSSILWLWRQTQSSNLSLNLLCLSSLFIFFRLGLFGIIPNPL